MKKSSILIILIILAICVVGFLCFGNSLRGEVVKVGGTDFIVPEGYHQDAPNKLGDVTISNGTHKIFLEEHNDTDVDKYIKNYESFCKKHNQTVKVSKLNVDGVEFYKSFNEDNPQTVYYWFIKGDKTYDIYKWHENKEMDHLVIDFIKSN
jgi:hypothetical protein